MIVYRFANPRYANDLSGIGAKIKGGRWNNRGIAALYASENISLALLEVLANANTLEQLQEIQLMEIEIPDSVSIRQLTIKNLKEDWYYDFEYTQWLGSEVLNSQNTLLLQCPSAVVHKEHNLIINPLHKDFKKVKLKTASSFYFDERLFKQ